MWNKLLKWWYREHFVLVYTICGKFIKETPYRESAALYYCYVNLYTNEFRINVGHCTITGKLKDGDFPDRLFFKQFMFHGDYDG